MNVATLVIVSAAAIILAILAVVVLIAKSFGRQAQRLGYSSRGEYLAAAPITDEQKRDAVSLALKGVVICILGLVFPPFLLIGPFPLFYGLRKVAWASMGLGLVDDAEQPSA